MANLKELKSRLSPENQARVEVRVSEIRREISLQKLREEAELSQAKLAELLGVKQPAIAKLEKIGNDPKLSSIKRYVAGLDGKLSLNVTLPDGRKLALEL